jgi:hypothetical protein
LRGVAEAWESDSFVAAAFAFGFACLFTGVFAAVFTAVLTGVFAGVFAGAFRVREGRGAEGASGSGSTF